MSDSQKRSFGEVGETARGVFVVHRDVQPSYLGVIQRLFGNSVQTGYPDNIKNHASALTVTDPTKWIFPIGGAANAEVEAERDKVKEILGPAGSYDQMIVAVHAPKKKYERDALAVLKECSKIFDPKHLLLVIDDKSHTQFGGEARYGHEGQRGGGPDSLVTIADNDPFFRMKNNLTILRLDSTEPSEISRQVTDAVRQILKPRG